MGIKQDVFIEHLTLLKGRKEVLEGSSTAFLLTLSCIFNPSSHWLNPSDLTH